jgi:hypothetical protein
LFNLFNEQIPKGMSKTGSDNQKDGPEFHFQQSGQDSYLLS